MLDLSIQQIAMLCHFSADRVKSSDEKIWWHMILGIAVQYNMFKVQIHTFIFKKWYF